MRITLLEENLRFARINLRKEKKDLKAMMHHLIYNMFYNQSSTFFSITISPREISLIAEETVFEDFNYPEEFLEMSPYIYRPLQIDQEGTEESVKRITSLSSCFSNAGISMFYLTTFYTDYVFVKDTSINEVKQALKETFKIDLSEIDHGQLSESFSTPPEESYMKERGSFDLYSDNNPMVLFALNRDQLTSSCHALLHLIFYSETEFTSFTLTPDGATVIAPQDFLEVLPNSNEIPTWQSPLQLIGVDVSQFSLERHGIIKSISQPLSSAGINLLFLSTFGTANILIEEKSEESMRILQDSGIVDKVVPFKVIKEI